MGALAKWRCYMKRLVKKLVFSFIKWYLMKEYGLYVTSRKPGEDYDEMLGGKTLDILIN